ncbi:DUF2231 domain-containing protein [Luteimonas sp. RIT-PG2_3]
MRKQIRQPAATESGPSLKSRMAILGHPIHPMLVVYPTAFLSMAFVTDLVFLWLQVGFWAQVSYWLCVAGLVLGVLAGCVGAIDVLTIRSVRRHVSAWSHAVAAVMLLALAAAGVWLRHPDPEAAVWPWGLLQSAATTTMAMVAGWLGGTLTFRHGIGVYGSHEP